MAENLPCENHDFHYLRRNRIAAPAGSSCRLQETIDVTTFPTRRLVISRPAAVDAQSGDPAAGALPQHAGTAAAHHWRPRVRACADDREPRRQDAVPGPPAASAPKLVPPVHVLTIPRPPPQPKENCH